MMIFNRITLLSIILAAAISHLGCTQHNDPLSIAFLADIHLQDIYAQWGDTDYRGIKNPANGKYNTIRTMDAQLHSTRIFNENYFAFIAALDDIVSRKIKYVVMPGDFSDDGQPINIRALKRILEEYRTKHGIFFLMATGNHDPVRPFNLPAGKTDFMGLGGKEQVIMSQADLYNSSSMDDLPVVITSDIQKSGYRDITNELADFGFFPKSSDLYWASPYSSYSYEDYDFDLAKQEAVLDVRQYTIGAQPFRIPDVSYLSEPIEGVWFLSIDANVYVPKQQAINAPHDPNSYEGASTGFNNVMHHKSHLIPWIKEVIKNAKRLDKTLIPFSHYPMIDFNDDATADIAQVLGENKLQLHRVPSEIVAQTFADAGLKVHFGGHMHINDTGERTTEQGNHLTNVQVPSLAAYIPGYKIATIHTDRFEVETVKLDKVPRFNELFPLYQMEHDYLQSQNHKNLWNDEILKSKSYHEYTEWHLKELIRFRFMQDWPKDLKDQLLSMNGLDLLRATLIQHASEFDDFVSSRNLSEESIQRYDSLIRNQSIIPAQLEAWTGYDLILDFYRLRSADELAFMDIGQNRLAQYELLYSTSIITDPRHPLQKSIHGILRILHSFAHGAPADHFNIDLKTGVLSRVDN
ncbi:metallophosphoesterase [Reichenbachiella sp. MSK19-1]|uniref:metallophosphoesterase family protein n=1 Tax=Reichenbachiella sp. MSK19-1 TaxID=1897631 RepID=UPI000EEFA651|nr:metallophosphoesterase [Reichenbachiella sp. MSK19-1]RJE70610.1 hypothetical protein BGP76_11025 [Reichenbachiella sp. MSK19-1]